MKHAPITQKAKTKFTFKDNMDISMNADGTGGAFKSPNKNLEKVAEQLEGAVKAHGEQAKAVRKHIKEMKSPAKRKDACYTKVKSRYTKWPSAYASGALAKCRKVGAANWGNKSKK